VDAESLLRRFIAERPRTLRAFEALAGSLDADVRGGDRFHVHRPRYVSGVESQPFSTALQAAGLEFDKFRDDSDDPAVSLYRLTFRLPYARAIAIATELLGAPTRKPVDGIDFDWFGDISMRDHGDTIVDWAPIPDADDEDEDEDDDDRDHDHDPAVRRDYLASLPGRLSRITLASELRVACTPPPAAGIRVSASSHTVWRGTERVPARAPRVQLGFAAPLFDARELARMWGIDRPIAVSGDVHQSSWSLVYAGEEIPDPYGKRIASYPIIAGPWVIEIDLDDRPDGPLPGVSCGASPAYDLRERDAKVAGLQIMLRDPKD
jgi:hypothetical protein